MDSGDNANGVEELSTESPAAAVVAASPPSFPVATTKGHGLRRWRRIRREPPKEDSPTAVGVDAAGGGTGGDDEDSTQLHKRRLPLPSDAPKVKHDAAAEEGSSAASVESRFVPLEASPGPTKLDPDLGLLIASAGFSVGAGGADSDNSEDRSSKSTAASAPRVLPRHDFSLGGFPRERDRARSRGPGASPHGKNLRSARARGDRVRTATITSPEAENSRSSVESDIRSFTSTQNVRPGAGIAGNGIHKVLSDEGEHSDEGQLSEEVRSTGGGYYKENGSLVGRLARGTGDFDADVEDALDEGSVGNGENGGMCSGDDPYVKSIVLLQAAQEALENEIQKFMGIGKESSDISDANYDETEWIDSSHLDEPGKELSEKIKYLESRLEEASALIMEKDSSIVELEALNQKQPVGAAVENTNLLSLQADLDQLLKEKIEAEIQCLILTRASQSWEPLVMDQIALYDAQKSLSGDYKQLRLKLRHAENKAMMLEEMTEKLEAQCKDLSGAAEVLKLQTRASRVSLFCFIQFLLLCVAVGTFLLQILPSSTEVVPT